MAAVRSLKAMALVWTSKVTARRTLRLLLAIMIAED